MEANISKKPSSADELLRAIQHLLRRAFNEDLLKIPMETIWRHIKIDGPPTVEKDTYVITGGRKSFDRRSEDAVLIRNDNAWLHFAITVRQQGGSILTISYNFEIVFDGNHQPRFLRFDLNEPGHKNADRNMRSHFHPGNDDLMAPSAEMEPLEVLRLMVYDLRPRNIEKRRATSRLLKNS